MELEKRKRGRPPQKEVLEGKIDELRTRHLYAAKLFNKGYTRHKVSEELQAKYNVQQTTAAKYINEAYKIIAEKQDNLIRNLRYVQLSRLELLWEAALEKKDIRTANEVIKTINSLFGLSQPENQVNIQNNYEIKFDE